MSAKTLGLAPIWSRDGSHIIFSSNRDGVFNLYKNPVSSAKEELYYRSPDGRVMAVEVTAGAVFQSTNPKPIFQAPPVFTATTAASSFGWDVTADGNRFVLATATAGSSASQFTVVLNWTSLLKK